MRTNKREQNNNKKYNNNKWPHPTLILCSPWWQINPKCTWQPDYIEIRNYKQNPRLQACMGNITGVDYMDASPLPAGNSWGIIFHDFGYGLPIWLPVQIFFRNSICNNLGAHGVLNIPIVRNRAKKKTKEEDKKEATTQEDENKYETTIW